MTRRTISPLDRNLFFRPAMVLAVAILFPIAAQGAETTDAKGDAMTYREAKQFLKQHTQVVELTSGKASVLVCPELQGRVMTSTCDGDEGRSLGWVNRAFIEKGE